MTLPSLALVALGVLVSFPARARSCSGLSPDQIKAAVVRESRAAYYATGHPCACPDDIVRGA